MITTKERAVLRGIAQKEEAIFQIGKNGVTETLLTELDIALEARELIKISVLKSSDLSAKLMINEVAEMLKAEPVQAIGNKLILYRRSRKSDVKHLL